MGLFDFFRRRPTATPDADDDSFEVTDELLLETVRETVLPGFATRDEVVDAVGESLEIPDDPRIPAVVDRVWAQRLEQEAAHEGRSDFDRVRTAFLALGEQGVLARMNFTCCQTCGTAEIDDERTPLPGGGEGQEAFREWGYTFFHQQDAERLADSPSVLYLSYSTFGPAPESDETLLARCREGDDKAKQELILASQQSVGHRVSDALREQGLEVDWDGDTDTRIAVTITDWAKPLPR